MFNFKETEQVQSQIEQLKAQLQQLEGQIAPYQECEAIASSILQQVEDHRRLMVAKEVSGDSLISWAIALYESAAGEDFEVPELPAENEELVNKYNELVELLKESEEFAEIQSSRIADLEVACEMMKKQADDAKKDANSDRVFELESEVASLRQECDRLNQSASQGDDKERIASLEQQLKSLFDELEQANRERDLLDIKIDNLEDELQDERQINASSTLKRALEAEAKIEELTTTIASKTIESSVEMLEAIAKIEELTAALSEKDTVIDDLTLKIGEFEERLDFANTPTDTIVAQRFESKKADAVEINIDAFAGAEVREIGSLILASGVDKGIGKVIGIGFENVKVEWANGEVKTCKPEFLTIVEPATAITTAIGDEGIRPFSNGSEYSSWVSTNCDRCQNSNDCDIASAMDAALMGDGTVDTEIAIRMGGEYGNDGWGFPSECNEFQGANLPTSQNAIASKPIPVNNDEFPPAKPDKAAELFNFGRGDASRIKAKMEAVTWLDIVEACDRRFVKIQSVLAELSTSRSAIKKEMYSRIEYLIAKSVIETGDYGLLELAPQGIRMGASRLIDEANNGQSIEPVAPEKSSKTELEDFLTAIARSSTAWHSLTWDKVREAFKCDREAFDAFAAIKATKTQAEKRYELFEGRFAQLLRDYILENGTADMDWIPEAIAVQTELLLSVSTPYPAGAIVTGEGGVEYEVISYDIDTEWLQVKDSSNHLLSIHVSEIVQEQESLSF